MGPVSSLSISLWVEKISVPFICPLQTSVAGLSVKVEHGKAETRPVSPFQLPPSYHWQHIVLFYSLIRALENMLYKLSNKGEKKLLVCIYRYVCTGRKAKNK